MNDPNMSWRIERSVTLGVIVALALQTGGALIWAGAAGERLDRLERQTSALTTTGERLARLEEQIGQARESLNRIERRLDE
ncbi:MAG: hypothetical protein CMF74_08355 [Maricaulis sp.]|jgi:hypothetical protein|nr:hypothetical protein [Maricaulis sp.]|tara:strand:- start:210 stop:452 length:243 start_codon:yes stop_codon:yes gene_type:complete